MFLKPKINYDERGFFQEIYRNDNFPFKQVNCSFSVKNTLRGIHAAPYDKLVTLVKGKIFDVVVDLEKLEWKGWWLEQGEQIYVKKNFGHAFYASEDSLIVYLTGEMYEQGIEDTIRFDDPKLNIDFPLANYILSERDKNARFL